MGDLFPAAVILSLVLLGLGSALLRPSCALQRRICARFQGTARSQTVKQTRVLGVLALVLALVLAAAAPVLLILYHVTGFFAFSAVCLAILAVYCIALFAVMRRTFRLF